MSSAEIGSSLAKASIEIHDVRKSYMRGGTQVVVLDNLSLAVAAGEFFALMGPSGSGKTTLLNLIAGLDSPDSGSIVVNGSALQAMSEAELASWRARTIGFVFQFYNLIPVLNALENVALPLSLFSMSKKERRERAQFALSIVGLADRQQHRPRELSGGQEQRVAIARAIVTDPAILIADEPTGDLDRASAREIMELLARLHQEHRKTIAMVTHDPHTAEYAARVIRLDKGMLVES